MILLRFFMVAHIRQMSALQPLDSLCSRIFYQKGWAYAL